uniref:Uncharacterized protein n=1 Tax=Arundo donax TaxID=35708 RepID=A0A0A9BGA5_ARUDO
MFHIHRHVFAITRDILIRLVLWCLNSLPTCPMESS